jgi:hypothetical protein
LPIRETIMAMQTCRYGSSLPNYLSIGVSKQQRKE